MTVERFPKNMRTISPFGAGAILAVSLATGPGAAQAYTISTAISPGCHEKITSEALRAVRLDVPNAAPLPTDRNERALISDVQFTPPADMLDIGGTTLLVSVRDNDLKGQRSSDLSQLALVHGDPNAQLEHCLRSSHQSEPGGSEAAVLACRGFIRERIGQALDGLDATGKPDLANRTALSLYLSLRHHVDAPLPTYYVRIGQAIHAIEDSFTHTYRTADGMKITVVLDWIDEANGNLVEANDGPPHAGELDRCDDPDSLRQRRRELATEAATAVLRTTLAPNDTKAQKMAAVEGILDKYISYSPGCSFDNNWCQAPERQYANGNGCSMGGPESRISVLGAGAVLGLVLTLGRRGWRRRRGHALVGLTALLIAGVVPVQAHAQAAPNPPSPAASTVETHAAPAPITTPVAEPGPKDPSQTAFGASLGGSGAIDNGALAAALGARFRASRHWAFGLDAEWNPWVNFNGKAVRRGVFNGYGSAILRLPLAYEKFNLRVTGSLGVSRLLMDLYGAPKNSTGIYAGFSPLGLEWKMSRVFFLVINPLNFAIPTPQLKNVPFSYPQYRATIGLEIYGG